MEPLGQATPAATETQFLTFALNGGEYGLPLLSVQEIRGYTVATPIPHVAPHVKGILNLRGTVLPIMDLRIAFGLPESDYDKFNVIVVTRVGTRLMGLVVDSFSDVVDVRQDGLQPPPDFGKAADTRFIQGLFPTRAGLAIALHLDRLFDHVTPLAQADGDR